MSYGIMLKTVSQDCNLACRYCYYSHVAGKPRGIRVPERSLLEKILRDYLATCGPVASIAWQGGEPLLAGLPFFQDVVALEARWGRPGQIVSNALQTNGILLNQQWAQFFARYRFLLGVSLDGPQPIHDRYRVDAGGRGTFTRVMRGIDWLRRGQVEFNILTVVGPHNVRSGGQLLEFFQQQDLRWVQFIPQMLYPAQNTREPGRFAITPAEYGTFLCDTFDAWYRDGSPTISIRFFDSVLQTYLGTPPDLCTLRANCPPHLVIESNGDVYPCDFYLDDSWRLGNAGATPLVDLFQAPNYHRFAGLKPELPATCRQCPWLAHCRGGCPRNRNWTSDAPGETEYFCAAYQQFFAHADTRLRKLAATLKRRRLHA